MDIEWVLIGTSMILMGIGLCCGDAINLGIMFIIVGIFIILFAINTINFPKKVKDNRNIQVKQKNTKKEKYKKYVKIRLRSSNRVYTYLSNPNYPLYTGQFVDIRGSSGTERVYVVEGDTLLPEKTDMNYKVIPTLDKK